jgi:hypothetical protein
MAERDGRLASGLLKGLREEEEGHHRRPRQSAVGVPWVGP